jgi:hypothetical protein
MHALEWIQHHGRFMRLIGADALRMNLSRQKRECTWCGASVPKHRSRWCSTKCVDEFKRRCMPFTIRSLVWKRDDGQCQLCGLDVKWLKTMVRKFRYANTDPVCVGRNYRKNLRGRKNARRQHRYRMVGNFDWSSKKCKLKQWIRIRGFNGISELWEADHKVPVVEGGGLCDESGYRLLCIPCHKKATRELRARLSEKNRVSKMSLLNTV